MYLDQNLHILRLNAKEGSSSNRGVKLTKNAYILSGAPKAHILYSM